jgi:NitT/TauT family transport system substrate-binding protein
MKTLLSVVFLALTPLLQAAELSETKMAVPRLPAAVAYQPADNTIVVELSEYAGYGGLIVANGGLEANENSVFFKKHGFKVKLTLSEAESWPALNSGKMAASATTVDVLAIYGRQFGVVVPALISYSRGADGLVVRSDIKRINELRGKTIVTAQFTEADFFIRYLAFEAGLQINIDPKPDPDKLNLVFCEDGFAAGDVFLQDIKSGKNQYAGCVSWSPKTGQVVAESSGKARILTTSKNLLIVADILIVNKGFAKEHPEMVTGLVDGLLEGNRLLRENPDANLDVVAKAFKWDSAKAKAELAKVHLANLPENLAFFSGAIDTAGSFGGIFQSANYAYGSLIRNPADPDSFADTKALKAVQQGGTFANQRVNIAPIGTANVSVENDPLLSKNIRFLFQPNSAILDLSNAGNIKNLEAIKGLLQVSPGSMILLRGHVDNARIEEFRKQGGEQMVRTMALKSVELSKNRALEIKRLLQEKLGVDASRIETIGRGWDEPLGTDSDQNRRVEVQWFTVE